MVPITRVMRIAALTLSALALALPSAALAAQPPSTPELIDAADRRGRISDQTANLYRAYAIGDPGKLPPAYRSDSPWDGTLTLLKLRREVAAMPRGAARERIEDPISSQHLAAHCGGETGLSSSDSARFHVDHTAIGGGLDIDDYKASLETSWSTEVDSFRWAAPPVYTPDPPPGNRYHVVVAPLGPGLYGFVTSTGTHAGTVGNNPNTSWDDGESLASCMVLNNDYSGFPGSPQQALDATTAHEFNHSIQFGYGVLDRHPDEPDLHMVEGGATWMEDEVFDGANDNYNYLYPDFEDSMGRYEGDVYSYWLTFRGLTERFGANTPGGAEQVMQDYWEIVSREQAFQLDAMSTALANKGRTLPGAFHDYAIAAKFMQTCGSPGLRPFCFEEAAGYTSGRGTPASHGSAAPGTPHNGSIEDNYAINWIDLPASGSGSYDVTLTRTGGAGELRGTIACSTTAGVAMAPFPGVVNSSTPQTVPGFDSDSCPGTPVVAITNERRAADNPDTDSSSGYTVSTASAPPATTATVPPAQSEVPPDNGPDPGTGSPGTSSGSGTGTGTGSGTASVLDTIRPVVSSLSLSNRRFRAARSGRAITAAPVAMRVRYRLSERATLTVRYERRTIGRRVGGRCVATTRANRSRTRCLRWVLLRGSATHAGRAGPNSFRLTGRWRGRALKPAVYRLRLSARDAARNVSATRRTASFRIVRR